MVLDTFLKELSHLSKIWVLWLKYWLKNQNSGQLFVSSTYTLFCMDGTVALQFENLNFW